MAFFDMSTIKQTAKRIFCFFFAPQTSDMNHIIIAWGTTLCTFLFILVIIIVLLNLKAFIEKAKADSCLSLLGMLYFGLFIASILSLWLLKKPDGNYFMLFYVIVIITATSFYEGIVVNDVNKSLCAYIFTLFIVENVFIYRRN